jgi:LysM repeat protein
MPTFLYPAPDASITGQINARQLVFGQEDFYNTDSFQNYKFNNSAWIRLASSVNITGSDDEVSRLFNAMELPQDLWDSYKGDGLAKNNILFNGISKGNKQTYITEGETPDSDPTTTENFEVLMSSLSGGDYEKYFINTDTQNPLNDFTYGFGGITQGIRPQPGIKSVNVSYLNRGTNAKIEIEIIAFNRAQLAMLDALYLHPGYNLLIEWGHTSYIDNSATVVYPNTKSSSPAITQLFSGEKTSVGSMLTLIQQEAIRTNGNYSGFFGPISNFSYSFNPDGTYTCKVTLLSMGSIVESMKLNIPAAAAKFESSSQQLNAEIQALQDEYNEKLAELQRIQEEAEQSAQEARSAANRAYVMQQQTQGNALDALNVVSTRLAIDENGNTTMVTTSTQGEKEENNLYYQELADKAAADAQTAAAALEAAKAGYDPDSISSDSRIRFSNLVSFWLDIQKQNLDVQYNKSSKPAFYINKSGYYTCRWNLSKDTRKDKVDADGTTIIHSEGAFHYIRLGSLLNFIKKFTILGDSENTGLKLFSIDTTTSNFCTRSKISVSSMPDICIVDNPDQGSEMGNINKLNEVLSGFKIDSQRGRTMNIWVNIDYAAVAASQHVSSTGELSLFDYIRHLMNGISSSLGEVNDFEVSFDNYSGQVKIQELAYASGTYSTTSGPIPILNVYGFRNVLDPGGDSFNLGSFVENVSFTTQLDKNLGALSVASAQASSVDTLSVNATPFAVYNQGLVDRTFPTKVTNITAEIRKKNDESLLKPDNFTVEEVKSVKTKIILFYQNSVFDINDSIQFQGALAAANKYSVNYEIQKGARPAGFLLPFNLSISMMGIGGFKLFERIRTDNKILPPTFDSLDFIIKSISHSVTNKWVTKIETFAAQASELVSGDDLLDFSAIKGESGGGGHGEGVWTGEEPQFTERVPKSITIHITQGGGTAQGTVNFVGRKSNEDYDNGGIHWAVDRSGTTASGIPENKRSIHGNNWNTSGIGIEIGNWGALTKNSDGTGTPTAKYAKNTRIPANEIVDLGWKFGGHQYFQEYSDVQITALKTLIQAIVGRWPVIKDGFKGSVWDIWGMPRPVKGQAYTSSNTKIGNELREKTWSQPGIWSHFTGKEGGHVDAIPTPKLINMLVSLGYTK